MTLSFRRWNGRPGKRTFCSIDRSIRGQEQWKTEPLIFLGTQRKSFVDCGQERAAHQPLRSFFSFQFSHEDPLRKWFVNCFSIAVSDTGESQRLTTFEIDTENEKIVYLRRIKRNQARYATEKNRAYFAVETEIIRVHIGRFIRVLMVVSLESAHSRYPRATMIPSW